jgi:hypothetical protein
MIGLIDSEGWTDGHEILKSGEIFESSEQMGVLLAYITGQGHLTRRDTVPKIPCLSIRWASDSQVANDFVDRWL